MTSNKPGQGKINTHRRFKSVKLLAFSLALVFLLSNPVLAYAPEDFGVWHFDEVGGATAFDSTDNHNDLVNPGGAPWVTWTSDAIFGNATKTSSNYFFTKNINIQTSVFTLGFWFKDDQKTENEGTMAFFGGYTYIKEYSNKMLVRVYTSGGNILYSPPVDIINTGYHHIAWVVNGSIQQLYYDGIKILEGPNTSALPFTLSKIQIGGGTGTPTQAFYDDLFLTLRALTDEEVLSIYTIGEPYTGIFGPPPPEYLRPPPTLTLPIPDQEIVGNFVNVQGTCWHPGVDILNETTNETTLVGCQYSFPSYYYYDFKEDINFEYNPVTGRPGGYVEFTTPPGYFAGLIRQDANDVRIIQYDNDLNYHKSEPIYWADAGVFKFYADAEVESRQNPQFTYSLVYGYQFEDEPQGRIEVEPVTDYLATRGPTQDIKGVFETNLFLDYGEYTITARTSFEFPDLVFTEPTLPVTFTLIESLTPPGTYSWTDPVIWYGEVSRFDQPTAFLSYVFDLGQGTLSPLMSKMDNFTQFFDQAKAQQDALNITEAIKVVISYTKLFDNFFGSFPVSWALILLIIVYVAKFVIIYTAKAIQTFKPF